MKDKRPRTLSEKEMEKKSTKELLGYLKRLQKCEESFELSDMDINLDLVEEQIIYFKQTEKWKRAYNQVKSILDKRDHIGR